VIGRSRWRWWSGGGISRRRGQTTRRCRRFAAKRITAVGGIDDGRRRGGLSRRIANRLPFGTLHVFIAGLFLSRLLVVNLQPGDAGLRLQGDSISALNPLQRPGNWKWIAAENLQLGALAIIGIRLVGTSQGGIAEAAEVIAPGIAPAASDRCGQ